MGKENCYLMLDADADASIYHLAVTWASILHGIIFLDLTIWKHIISIQQVSFFSTSPVLSNRDRFPYFLRTIPSDVNQAQAMVELVKMFNWTYVSVVYEESSYGIQVRFTHWQTKPDQTCWDSNDILLSRIANGHSGTIVSILEIAIVKKEEMQHTHHVTQLSFCYCGDPLLWGASMKPYTWTN